MKMSELILAVGDDNVQFQNLDHCALAEVLRLKVRAWADDQIAAETEALTTYDHGKAEGFSEGAGRS